MATLLMSNGIVPSFLNYSRAKTMDNVETMGILFGKMNQKKTTIKCKKLLLFDQFGSGTMCGLTDAGTLQLADAMANAGPNEGVIGFFHLKLMCIGDWAHCLSSCTFEICLFRVIEY